jgi:hypothetical protein
MLNELWLQGLAWWSTLPREFAFLLVLPFAVGTIGLVADAWRRHGRR